MRVRKPYKPIAPDAFGARACVTCRLWKTDCEPVHGGKAGQRWKCASCRAKAKMFAPRPIP